MTTMPWLRAAKTWIIRRGSGAGSGQERVERRDDRLAAVAHKIQHAIAPIAGVEAELVLQTDHVAWAVVGRFRGQAVGARAAVVDDVDHARVVVAKHAVFWIAATEEIGSPAAMSTASAESLVKVASPHSSGG